MNRNYNFGQRVVAYILLISLTLQSCKNSPMPRIGEEKSSLSNSPLAVKEEQNKKKQSFANLQEDYQVTVYEEKETAEITAEDLWEATVDRDLEGESQLAEEIRMERLELNGIASRSHLLALPMLYATTCGTFFKRKSPLRTSCLVAQSRNNSLRGTERSAIANSNPLSSKASSLLKYNTSAYHAVRRINAARLLGERYQQRETHEGSFRLPQVASIGLGIGGIELVVEDESTEKKEEATENDPMSAKETDQGFSYSKPASPRLYSPVEPSVQGQLEKLATDSASCYQTLQEALDGLPNNDPKKKRINLRHEKLDKKQLEQLKKAIKQNSVVGYIYWGRTPVDCQELKEKIEKKLEQNICKYTYHPNDYVHGLLASHVYNDPKKGKQDFNVINKNEDGNEKGDDLKLPLPDGISEDWEVVQVQNDSKGSGFYSALYVNKDKHQAVLAFQGTYLQDISRRAARDLIEDMRGVLGNAITKQQELAFKETKSAIDYVKGKGYNLSITGHSLGGYLAEVAVGYCYYDLDFRQVKAIVFDSPGADRKLSTSESNVKNKSTELDLGNLPITTYLSAPNLVNSCNGHLGEVYRVYPDLKLSDFLPSTWWDNLVSGVDPTKDKRYYKQLVALSGHLLFPILKQFSCEKGKPEKYNRMANWPTLKKDAIQYIDNPGAAGKVFGRRVMGWIGSWLGGWLGGVTGFIIGGTRVYPAWGYAGLIGGGIMGGVTLGSLGIVVGSDLGNLMAGEVGRWIGGNIGKSITKTGYLVTDALASVITVLLDVHNVELEQIFTVHLYLDENFKEKELEHGEEFKLKHEGKYQLSTIKLDEHILDLKEHEGVDQYLYKLYRNKEALKQFSNRDRGLELSVLNRILEKYEYEIKSINGNAYLHLKEGYYIEDLRDKVKRALDILQKSTIDNVIKDAWRYVEDQVRKENDKELQYKLGEKYEAEKDYKKARNYFLQSANQEYAPAQYKLGEMYENGRGVENKDDKDKEENYKQAKIWYEKAANPAQGQGYAPAQYKLGEMHENGTGGEKKDEKKAVELYGKSAKQDYAPAQYALGRMHEDGRGVEKNEYEAEGWYKRADKQDHVDAQYKLGQIYLSKGDKANEVQRQVHYRDAVYWYHKAAEREHVDAQLSLGRMYHKGNGVTIDLVEASRWYQKASAQGCLDAKDELKNLNEEEERAKKLQGSANKGEVGAQYNLGLSYEKGEGVDPNYEEAKGYYKKAAKQRHPDAQYRLGCMYTNKAEELDEFGREYCYYKASEWLRKAAEQGHADAQYSLGLMYADGKGVKDLKTAAEWYLKAADQGHPNGQFSLAYAYYCSHGVEKNNVKAFELFKKAAEQTATDVPFVGPAQYYVGLMYKRGEVGESVTIQQQEAENWFEKAKKSCEKHANQGSAMAQYHLGAMYENGHGVEQDYSEALKWYHKAADQGYAEAQFNLGVRYENGTGIEKDHSKALAWYRKAAEKGHEVAKIKLNEIEHEKEYVYLPTTGTITSFGGKSAPNGWLMCDGKRYSNLEYPELYEVLKEKFIPQGEEWIIKSNESSLEKFFYVPDLRGRVVVGVDGDSVRVRANNKLGESGGEEMHQLTIEEMPKHSHKIDGCRGGAGPVEGSNNASLDKTSFREHETTRDTYDAGGSHSHNNMQPYLILNYIINAGRSTNQQTPGQRLEEREKVRE